MHEIVTVKPKKTVGRTRFSLYKKGGRDALRDMSMKSIT
jgi:hypothetical protein